jgi:tricorn protease
MHRFVRCFVLVGVLLLATGAAEAQIDARLLRQPDVSATEIAFVYGGVISVVSKEGGLVHRLSTPAGEESFPRFSPNGQQIAFTGNFDGNQDIRSDRSTRFGRMCPTL